MIGPCYRFGRPFLLVESSTGCIRSFGARKIVEVVFVPRLTEFLEDISMHASTNPRLHSFEHPLSS